jgi:hypothetical protein
MLKGGEKVRYSMTSTSSLLSVAFDKHSRVAGDKEGWGDI